MQSIIVPDNAHINLSFVKCVVLWSTLQGVILHNLAVIWFSIVSVWCWGSESGWVRPQPHFRTACSCSWTLQCTTELKLRTAIEDFALNHFQSRPLKSTTQLKQLRLTLESFELLLGWSCLNITKYHILEAELWLT